MLGADHTVADEAEVDVLSVVLHLHKNNVSILETDVIFPKQVKIFSRILNMLKREANIIQTELNIVSVQFFTFSRHSILTQSIFCSLEIGQTCIFKSQFKQWYVQVVILSFWHQIDIGDADFF